MIDEWAAAVSRPLIGNTSSLCYNNYDGLGCFLVVGLGRGRRSLRTLSLDPGSGIVICGVDGCVGDGVGVFLGGFFFLEEVDMSDTPKLDKNSVNLVLTELRRQHDVHLEAVDMLDEKAINLLEWSSLALAVVAAISTPDLAKAGRVIPLVAVSATLALYVLIVVISLRVISPKGYELPIGIDLDEMCSLYLTKAEQGALLQLLRQYTVTIEHNRAVEVYKDRFLKWGFRVFPVLILTLAATATSSLWSGYFR